MTKQSRTTKLATLILCCTILAGCAARGAQQSTATQTQAPRAPLTQSADVHFCGARTTKNKPCRMRVAKEGDRCPYHTGRPAMKDDGQE